MFILDRGIHCHGDILEQREEDVDSPNTFFLLQGSICL